MAISRLGSTKHRCPVSFRYLDLPHHPHQHSSSSSTSRVQPVSGSASQPTPSIVKCFREIPGPTPLPLIGNMWRYLPLIGQYSLDQMDRNSRYNLARYGPIVREEISAQHRIVHLFDPKDIESMFKQEGRYPNRRSHRALLKYRHDRPDRYRSGGLFPENGAEWSRLRDQFKRDFLLQSNINQYDERLDSIGDDLVRYLREVRRNRDSLEVSDMQQDLYRWALESICSIMLEVRMGCLEPEQVSDAAELIEAAHLTIDAVMRTELHSGWETGKETKDYRRLVRAQDVMADIVDRHLRKQVYDIERRTTRGQSKESTTTTTTTLLRKFVLDPQVDRKDLFAIILDFVLAGIDTTSITAGFVLYYLARNPNVQETVRSEICEAIGPDHGTKVRAVDFVRMPLMKASVKETMRLRPISIGVGRLTSEPIEIGEYRIPANTMLITQNQTACRLACHFDQPDQFRPERWLPGQPKPGRFLWLPFGHGTRMCLGRRIAELELYTLVTKMLLNFRVEYHHEDIGIRTSLINVPDRPMKYRLVDL